MTEAQARMVALNALAESPTNPRRRSDPAQDQELVESVKQLGVLQPVLARPVNGHLELVFGHRRLRAAREAGLGEIPVVVRELSDLEVLEAQLVENSARADVAPWDEAVAYKRLHTDHGRSVDEIAAKVGKSRAHIYGRLKLLDLCSAAQKALEKGEIEATVGLLIARIPSEKLQAEALRGLLHWGREEGVTFRQAQDLIQREFMLRLDKAPFDRAAADLVPAAGPCTTCPKRTGNQRELFGDVKSADLCTDPPCFRQKADAAWKLRAEAAKAEGHQVLDGKAAEKARYSGDFVKLGDTCWEDGKRRTYAKLLGKDAPPKVLVRESDGEAVELVRKAEVQKVLRAKGVRTQRDVSHQTGRNPAEDKARSRELELERRVLERMAGNAPKLASNLAGWRWLARAAVEGAWHDSLKRIVARRGLERKLSKAKHGPKYEGYDGLLIGWLATADVAGAQGLIVEVLAARTLHSLHKRDRYDDGTRNQAARLGAELLKIDLEALRAEVKADDAKRKEKGAAGKARGKKAAPANASKKASGKKRGPKPQAGVCRECACTDDDCSQCVEKTGEPCTWIEPDLCSACAEGV